MPRILNHVESDNHEHRGPFRSYLEGRSAT
jgi:hypothetical protein